MIKPLLRRIRLPVIIVISIVGALVSFGILATIIFPEGPGTVVTNDTNRTVTLNNCGDVASQILPGDVETLNPGDEATISSSRGQKGNVCNVYFKSNDVSYDPDACLPLPVRGGGEVRISVGLKPYPPKSTNLCDAYIKF